MSDAEQAVRVKKGEMDFGGLVEGHRQQVYRQLYRMVRSAAWAEELTQRVFVRALEHLSQWDPARGSFSSWLHTLAHNLAVNAIKARRHEPESLDAMGETGGPSVTGPAELHEARERKAKLFRLVAELEPDMRCAVVSFVLLHHRLADVAGILGCSQRRARYLVSAGLRRLRAEL